MQKAKLPKITIVSSESQKPNAKQNVKGKGWLYAVVILLQTKIWCSILYFLSSHLFWILTLSMRYLCISSDEESMHGKTLAMRRSECLYNICWLKSWFVLLFLDSKFAWNEIQICMKMKISKASCKWKRESATCWAYSCVKIASSVIWCAGYCSVLFGAETFKKCFSC